MRDMIPLFQIKKKADSHFSEIHTTQYIYTHVQSIKFGIIRGILSLLETK